MGCISVHTSRIGGNLSVDTRRIGGTCHVTTSLVCSINVAKNYVRVEPQYLWLTESNQFRDIVNVYSDVQWKAE